MKKGIKRTGADLECLLTCQELGADRLPLILDVCENDGFVLISEDPLLAYGDDPVEPLEIYQKSEIDSLLASSQRFRRCIAKLHGKLRDTETTLGLVLDFRYCVIAISVPEGVLWGFGDEIENLDFQKLCQFAKCCEDISSAVAPIYGYIGSESLLIEDMAPDTAEQLGAIRFDRELFSEKHMRELFMWYVSYVKGV